jgi:hypothetical protein
LGMSEPLPEAMGLIVGRDIFIDTRPTKMRSSRAHRSVMGVELTRVPT